MTSRRRMQALMDFELIQILPLIPAAISNCDSFWSRSSRMQFFLLRIFRTRFMLQGKTKPPVSVPRRPFFPVESTQTSSGSRSGLASTTLQKTRSPTETSGRFFFVAPSNARYESAGKKSSITTNTIANNLQL